MNSERDGGKVDSFTYRVVGILDDGYLFLKFPGNPDIFTQARFFNEIRPMAIDAIHLMRDIPKNQIEIELVLPPSMHLPRTYFGYLLSELINKAQTFFARVTFHTAPSADGKFTDRK